MSQLPKSGHLFAALGLVLLGGAVPAAAEPKPEASRLTIAVNGFKNDQGQAGIAVFHSTDGFPSDGRKAKALRIQKGKVQWTVPELKPGRYAILVLHDENSNGKMDTNLLGIPTEGYYGLPVPTIRRFYALTLTRADRVRILCGRPPRGFSWRQALVSKALP